MCLISKQSEPLIATEDIVCYKVIKVLDFNSWVGIYYSSTFGKFPFGFVHANGFPNVYKSPVSGNTIIEGGFFHAYLDLDRAKKLLTLEEFWCTPNVRLVKCIIPKGILYYKSINEFEVCSPSIIIYKDLNSKKSFYKRLIAFLHDVFYHINGNNLFNRSNY